MKANLRSAVSWLRLAGAGWCLALGIFSGPISAQNLVRVEEDWELVIGDPDSNSAGPQVTCTFSPYNHINETHFTLEFNHKSVPYWAPGGITLHRWQGEWRQESVDRPDRAVMQTSNETVTWTQVMEADDGVLTFQVRNGTSSTWGPFGYTGMLRLQASWPANHVNGYTPEISVARSGVAYAANRVKSLKLLQVRGTLSDGTTATDSTVRVVHQLSP